MGTTLTGTTPQDTYDSLIKVTDNGPLSGTAKYLSDGLGNDSALALSNARVGIGTASPSNLLHLNKSSEPELYIQDSVATFRLGINSDNQFFVYTAQAKDIYFSNNNAERLRITSAGNVGIGTSAPAYKLSVNGGYIQNTDGTRSVLFGTDGIGGLAGTQTNHYFRFITNDAERLRITDDGYVRLSSGSGGIQFNSDTAAANALDDYEEGTFTATLVPSTSGSITLSSSFQTGVYTKIGRQVTVRGYIAVQSVSLPVGAEVYLRGLPFTTNGGGGASVTFFDAPSYAGSNLVAVVLNGTTQINIVQSAALVSNGEEYYFTATYFV